MSDSVQPALVRALGRWTMVALVINGVIGSGIFGLPAPLAGQAWLDGSFPLPIPEYNAQPQTLTVTRYRQGPSESTPLL